MGILNEMFGEGDSAQPAYEGELLAKGTYRSKADDSIKGYKIYQKKYALKSLIPKLLLVLLALISSVMMIMTAEKGKEVMPAFCLMISVSVGVWFVSQPINNVKKFRRGLETLNGTEYSAEFYTDKVKISMVQAKAPAEEALQENSERSEADLALEEENEEIPATVIHLDSPIVDLLEKEDMFILVVNKAYVFIIPKSAFTEEENAKIHEKLSAIMGIRYKA